MLTVLAFFAAAASSPALAKPASPVMPVLTTAECADPKTRAARLAEIDGDKSWTGSADRFNADWKAYIDSRMAQLKLTPAEEAALMGKVAGSDEFVALQKKNEAILSKMGADFEGLSSGGEEQACTTVAGMLAALTPMMVNATAQYELLDAAVVAEAKRRGVTLHR